MRRKAPETDGHVEPEPYSVEDFAKETRLAPQAVRQMISKGELKTVAAGAVQRICATEACRIYEEKLRRMIEGVLASKLEERRQLARELRSGQIREAEVGRDGCVLYQRTNAP